MFAGDEKLTTALLDRLAPHATVLTTKGKSYRMRKRRGQGITHDRRDDLAAAIRRVTAGRRRATVARLPTESC